MDFEGEIAVIVNEIATGTPKAAVASHLELLVLVNGVSLRALAVREMKTGFGCIHAKSSTAFSPVAITPDEPGASWHAGRVELPLQFTRGAQWFGSPNAHERLPISISCWSTLCTQDAFVRRLCLGSGIVSNVAFSAGSSCISGRPAIEALDAGKVSTPFLHFGERARIEMPDSAGLRSSA